MPTPDSNTPHDLAIIGPLPPPYGGVSIHIKRLLPHLDAAGIDYVAYNISPEPSDGPRSIHVARQGWRWFLKYLLTGREPVVYVHTSRWDVWAAMWWLARVRGKRVIIAVHTDSLRRLWPQRSRWQRRNVTAAFRAARALVTVNSHVRDFLDELAGLGERCSVIPAFVEPVCHPEDEAGIDPAVRTFCAAHDPVILANGAPIVYDDGRDLYGIDMTLDLVDELRQTWPNLGVVWYMLRFTGWSSAYEAQVRRAVRDRGLTDHWLFAEPSGEMYPVFNLVDLFVRPTCSDGDAVSIREALHFRVPTVASDAAPRPEGTLVFGSRDQQAYTNLVRQTLSDLPAAQARIASLPPLSALTDEIRLLKTVLSEVKPGASRS